MNKYGHGVCILVTHSVVISLVTLVLLKAQDWYTFVHCHFILYTPVTLDNVW